MRQIILLLFCTCLTALVSNAQAYWPQTDEKARTFFRDKGATGKTSLIAETEFWKRLCGLYQKHTKDKESLRTPAIEFINDSIMLEYGEWELAALGAEKDQLFELGQQLVDDGTNDPIVLSYFADALLRRGQGTTAKTIAKRAVSSMEKSDYPKGIRILVLDRNYRALRIVAGTRAIDTARTKMVESGADWFKWASLSPNWQRPAWKYFQGLIAIAPMYNSSKTIKRVRVDNLGEVAGKYEKLVDPDAWVVEMLNGLFQRDLGWHFRGSGYAKTVSKENWALFEKHIEESGKHFTSAFELQSKWPEASYEMITIAGNSDEHGTQNQWFTRCVEAEIDYLPAYEQMLVYRSSRWRGSQEAIMGFSEFCLASDRYDTLVPYTYLRGLHAISVLEEVPWREILERPLVFETAETMLTRLAKHPSRSVEVGITKSQAKYLTELLCLCLKVEKYDKACKLFEELGDQVSAEVMANFGFPNHKYFRSRTYAYRELPDELMAFRKSLKSPHELREDSQAYQDAYVGLLAKSKDPQAKLFYETLINSTQLELDFHDGKWVDLKFDPDFLNWSGNSVNWTYESPTSATASNQRQGAHMQMYHLNDFPGPKEILADVELVSKGSSSIGVGISIGPMNGREGGRLFYANPLKTERGLASNGPNPKRWDSDSVIKPSSLHLKFWEPEQFIFYTDGYSFEVKSDPDFLQKPRNDKFKVGLGERYWSTDNGVVRFKNLRVRKLSIPPPPKGANENSLKYYDEAIEREPGYFSHHRMRGNICFGLLRYDDVASSYQRAAEIRPMDLALPYDYGDCLTRLGKFQEALDQFSKVYAAKKAPYNPESTSFMAMIYASAPDDKLKDAGLALKLAKEAMALAEKKQAINFLGLGLAQGANGDFESALQSLAEAKKLAKDKYNAQLIESAISAFEKDDKFELPTG